MELLTFVFKWVTSFTGSWYGILTSQTGPDLGESSLGIAKRVEAIRNETGRFMATGDSSKVLWLQ